MSTVITQVWNEAPLLAMWLDWHGRMFDRVIVIDCASDDGSRELAEDKGAEIVDGPTVFAAAEIDALVMQVEQGVSGLRIALNATEFLLTHPKHCASHWFIPSVSLVQMPDDEPFTWLGWFHTQRTHGVHWRDDFMLRRSRLMSRQGVTYPLGRHFMEVTEGPLIAHVAHCYVDDWMVERRLQIQTRIPAEDKARDLGFQHHDHGRGLTRDKVLAEQEAYRHRAVDCSADIAAGLSWC